MLVQMTSVGEATGSMESTLRVLASYYDNETDLKTKRAIALLEPSIIVVSGGAGGADSVRGLSAHVQYVRQYANGILSPRQPGLWV